MPNWCSTSIRILNSNQDTLRNLEQEFENAFRCNEIENGFGRMWLGNILSYLGYSEKEILYGDMKCRGEIDYIELRENELLIDTETAWIPMFAPILKMIEKYAPDSEITYYAEELGCEILCTNDLEMVGKVKVIACGNLPEALSWLYEADEYVMDKEEFISKVSNSMGWNIPIEKAEEKISEDFADSLCYFEWQFAEIEEWQ